ncbi:MAG: class I SAM-dependent methyltransferase, partial [Nanoarchaeota archaeon]|nr:class I SAM-dependent methyltransferase [Nanoarchaeota archaeon]
MNYWEKIFKSEGKVFLKPEKETANFFKIIKKTGVKKVLDLGCGSGRHVVLLSKKGFQTYGFDVSLQGLKITRQWLKELGLKAHLKLASCYEKFPYENDFFDAIISTHVIHHNYHDRVRFCISEIERVLKPGGIIFIMIAGRKKKSVSANSKIIGPRLYVPIEGREEGVIHYIYNKKI